MLDTNLIIDSTAVRANSLYSSSKRLTILYFKSNLNGWVFYSKSINAAGSVFLAVII